MKKLSVLGMLILVAMFSFTAKADIVTLDGANEIANAFFANSASSQKKQMKSTTQLEYAWDSNSLTQTGSSMMKSVEEDPTFYVFNNPDGEGFVIVSGDSNVRSVIGYSYEGNIPAADEIPAPMQDYLLGIDEEIKWARTNLTSSNKNLKSAEVPDGGNIVKYIETALWNQRSPFNKLCPSSTPTGCVPTAFAIVMRHHQWPAKGKVAILPTGSGTNTIDLSSHTYDWSKMPMSYSSYTTEQADAVAQIMYDLGVSMEATYGSTTDVNITTNIGKLFCQNFDYLGDDMAQKDIGYNDASWKDKISESLNADRPIPYAGTRIISEGESTEHGRHMFVLDGYTDNDYYHFNWGWGDNTNGWYTLTTMGPEGYQYIQSHKAYFNLRPNSTTYPVTATANPSSMGTVSVNMGTAGSTASAEMFSGATATLTAYPADGYALASWTKNGVVVGSKNTIEVKVGTSDNDYVANFDLASNVLVTKDYTIKPSTVGLTGSSKVGVVTYQTSDEYPAALSLASTKTDGTSLNAMSRNDDEQIKLYAYDQVTSSTSVKYTISVPEGYIITEYSFEYSLNSTSYPCSINYSGGTISSPADKGWHSLSPVSVNAQTAEFTMTAEKAHASSNFYIKNFNVTVAKEGGVTPPSGETVGIELYVSTFDEDFDNNELNNNCSVSSNVSTAVVGSQVVLTATTNPGYKFDGWSLDGETFISTDKSYSLTITSDMVLDGTVYVFAAFSKDDTPVTPTTYTARVAVNGTGGTATVAVGTGAASSSVEVEAGTEVTFYAQAAQGYEFVNWTNGTNEYADNPFVAPINANLQLTANFRATDEPSTPATYPTMTVSGYGDSNFNRYLAKVTASTATQNVTVFNATTEAELPNTNPKTTALIDKTATPIKVTEGETELSMTFISWLDNNMNVNGSTASCQMNWVQQAVYIDWNNDGDFTDSGEIYAKSSDGLGGSDNISASFEESTGYTRTIAIPANQAVGTYRMRVVYYEPSSPYTDNWHEKLFTDYSNQITKGRAYDFALQIVEGASTPEEPSTTLSAVPVFTMGENGSTYYRIPALVETANGTLVAIADNRGSALGDLPNIISIVAKTSTNKGATWSDMKTIAQGDASAGTSYGDAVAVYDEERGKIITVFVGNENYGGNTVGLWASTSSYPLRLYKSESSDNGASWTTPEDISESIYNAIYGSRNSWIGMFAGSGSAVQLKKGAKAGRLMFVVAARSNSTWGGAMSNYAVYSDDHGETWQVSTTAACTSGDEAKIVELENGDLLMSIKNRADDSSNGSGYRLMAKSEDYGATWTTASVNNNLKDPGCNGDVVSIEYEGTYYLLHSLPASTSTRENVTIYISSDNGQTWPISKQVYSGYSAYSSLEVLNDGTIGIIVEEGKWDENLPGSDGFNLKYYSYTMDQLLPETPEEPETPVVNNALELDGTRYMSIPNNDAFSIAGGGSYTITFKVKIPQFKSDVNMRFVNNRAYEGTANSATTGFDIFGGNSSSQAVSVNLSYDGKPWGNSFGWNTGLTENTWAHISWVLDGTTTYLYVDGVKKETKTGMSTLGMPSKANILVGAGYTNTDGSAVQPAYFTTGSIDDVRFYNKALSESEVSADMTSTVNSSTANLVAAYDFNNIQGLTVEDISGHGHTGTLVGFPEPDVQYTASVNAGSNGTANVNDSTSVTVNSGTEVTYTATANDGYRFTGWSNGTTTVSIENPYIFNITSDIELTANFREITLEDIYADMCKPAFTHGGNNNNTYISVATINGESITVPAATTPANEKGQKQEGATAVIPVYKGIDYQLDLTFVTNWGDIILYQIVNEITNATKIYGPYEGSWTNVRDAAEVMNEMANAGITVNDKTATFPLSFNNANVGDLVVVRVVVGNDVNTPCPTGISEGGYVDFLFEVTPAPVRRVEIASNDKSLGFARYISPEPEGTATDVTTSEPVTVEAYLQTGANARFVNWTIGDKIVGEEVRYTYTGLVDATIQANFVETCMVSVSSSDDNMGTATMSVSTSVVDKNTEVTLTATPAEGYEFTGWSDGSTDNPYTVTVTENISLTANFAAIPTYEVTVSTNDVNGGTATASSNSVLEGSSVTLTAKAATGYKFTGWYQGGELISTENPYEIQSVTGAIEYVANFVELTDELLLTFACVSDLHAQQDMISDPNNIYIRESATKTLAKIKAEENVDLIVLGGDYTSNNTIPQSSWQVTKDLLIEASRGAFKGTKTPVIYVNGNHEYEVANYDAIPKPYNAGDYYDVPMKTDIGALAAEDCFYETAINGTGEAFELLAAYHYVVNGFDFVVLNGGKYLFETASSYAYSTESVAWVSNKLATIYASDPNKTVFFLVHIPFSDSKGISNTNKGMDRYSSTTPEFAVNLKNTLAQYPNLIMLYGHDHGTDTAYIREETEERVTEYATDGSKYSATYYIQNFNTNKYLGYNSYNLATTDAQSSDVTVANSTMTSGAFIFHLTNATTDQTSNSQSYLHCGSSGRFSGNATNTESSQQIYAFEVADPTAATKTATKATSIVAGKTYMLVGVKDSKYYALTDELYLGNSSSQRMVGTEVNVTDETITYSGTATILWTINKKTSAAEKSFFSSFMGSMRYYENSFEDGQLADRRIIQALMVYVYSDRVELKMKNYGEGDVTSNGITVKQNLDPYISYRTVTHSAEQVTATPVITSTGGDVAPNTEVTVTVDAPDWHNLYYTTDGTEPTEKSTKVENKQIKFTSPAEGEVTVKVAAQEGIRQISTSASVTYQVVEPPVRTVKIASNDKSLGFAGYVSPQPEGTATDVTTSEPVTVMAYLQPDANSRFVNWTINGEEVGTNPDAFTYTGAEDATIQANFELKPLSFEVSATASPAEGGRVELFVGTSAPATSLTVEENTQVTFSAIVNEGYKFVRWSKNGQLVSNEPSFYIPITSTTALVAEFELRTTYSVVVNGGTANENAVSEIEKGTEVTFVATVPDGQEFVNWTDAEGNIVSTDETFTIKVVGEINITANFRVPEGEGKPLPNYCTPSGQNYANNYLTSVTTSGASENVSYSASSHPGGTYKVVDGVIKVTPGTSFTLNLVAKSLSTSTTSVYEDIRYCHASLFTDFDINGDFGDAVRTWGAQPPTNNIKGNYDECMNISATIEVPADAVLGKSYIRVIYTNAWSARPSACTNALDKGIAYDIEVEVVASAPTPTPEPTYVTNFGTSTRSQNDRKLTSVRFNDGNNTSKTINVNQSSSNGASIYIDKTSDVIVLDRNVDITSNITWTGSWMHSYFYIDFDNDGIFEASLGTNEIPNASSELIAFSFYGRSSENSGYDHKGAYITGDNRNVWSLKTFQIPSTVEAGTYRARFKIDWNKIDANAIDAPANHPCVVDFMVKIVDPISVSGTAGEEVTIKVKTDVAGAVTANGVTVETQAGVEKSLTTTIPQGGVLEVKPKDATIIGFGFDDNMSYTELPETVTEITLRNTEADEVVIDAPALEVITVVSDADNNVAKVSTASDLSQGVQVVVEKEIKVPHVNKTDPTYFNFLSMPFAFNTANIEYLAATGWATAVPENQIRILLYDSQKRANGELTATWRTLQKTESVDIAANQGFVIVGNSDLGDTDHKMKLRFTSATEAYNGTTTAVTAKAYRNESGATSSYDTDWNFNGVPFLTNGLIDGYTLYFHNGYGYEASVPADDKEIGAYQGVMYQADVTNNISKMIPVTDLSSVSRATNAAEDVFAKAYIAVDNAAPAKIILSDESSENFVVNEDAWYLAPTANAEPAAYFNIGGSDAAVTVQPEATELPMTVYTGAGTQHRIALSATDGEYEVYLKDAVTDEIVCLNDEDYNFTAAAKTTIANRFTVSMVEPTGIIEQAKAEGAIKAVVAGDVIKLYGTEEGDEVTLYTTGGMVITNAVAEEGVTTIETSTTGVLIIKVADQTIKVVK